MILALTIISGVAFDTISDIVCEPLILKMERRRYETVLRIRKRKRG